MKRNPARFLSSFANWPNQIAEFADLALVQLPGREDRLIEPLHESLPDLARQLAALLARTEYEQVVLLGHSMGATIAWWVAAELWHTHGRRSAVIVSSRVPNTPASNSWTSCTSLTAWFKQLGEMTPAVLVDPELQQLFRQTLDQDMAWMQREFNRDLPKALPLNLMCLCAQNDQLATFTQMSDWRNLTTGGFELHQLPGGHLHLINRTPAVICLVRQLFERAHSSCSMN